MKKILLFALGLLLLTAILPILTSADMKAKKESVSTPPASSTDEVPAAKSTLSEKDIENILCTALEYTDESSTTEYKKALITLCRNNYIYLKNTSSAPQMKISKYSDDDFAQIKEIYKTVDTTLHLNDKLVYIPILKSGAKNTATSDEYPYISCVASPWDTFVYDYNDDISYPCGISLYGISYLCNEGYDHINALKWYLPSFNIT